VNVLEDDVIQNIFKNGYDIFFLELLLLRSDGPSSGKSLEAVRNREWESGVIYIFGRHLHIGAIWTSPRWSGWNRKRRIMERKLEIRQRIKLT
jgi:hypothetical protein